MSQSAVSYDAHWLRCDRTNALAWPIPIPATAEYELIRVLDSLNEALNYWGYRENLNAFWKQLCVRYERALLGEEMESWVSEAEEQVDRGEELLDWIQDVLVSMPARGLSSDALHEVWRDITTASSNVQYVIAATKVHLQLAAHDAQVS